MLVKETYARDKEIVNVEPSRLMGIEQDQINSAKGHYIHIQLHQIRPDLHASIFPLNLYLKKCQCFWAYYLTFQKSAQR